MQRPKGNDLRRATFDGPPNLAPFAPGCDYVEGEVNRGLQALHNDHATLRRYLVDAGLLRRERNTYRRA